MPTVVVYENVIAAPKGSCGFKEGRDVWYADAIANQPTTAEVEWVEAEHPLFLLYTSGSTGRYGLYELGGCNHRGAAEPCMWIHTHCLAAAECSNLN